MIHSNDFEKIAKRRKRKNILRNVIISVIISVFAVILGLFSLDRLTSKHGQEIQEYYTTISEIAYPNISYSSWGYQPSSQFTGTFKSTRFKDIDGIEVPFETYVANYSIGSTRTGNSDDGLKVGDQGHSLYTLKSYNKVPMFFIKEEENQEGVIKPTQDIPLLNQMQGKAVEVAITFDKTYTLEEILERVPKNLQLNWIWIGGSSTSLMQSGLNNQFGFTPYFDLGLTASQQKNLNKEINQAIAKNPNAKLDSIYQKYQDKQVSPLKGMENSYTIFQENAEKYLALGTRDSSVIASNGKLDSSSQQLKKYLSKNADKKTAKFSGVILTGRSENFKQLEKVNWIYASNLGESIQIQPYHHLNK